MIANTKHIYFNCCLTNYLMIFQIDQYIPQLPKILKRDSKRSKTLYHKFKVNPKCYVINVRFVNINVDSATVKGRKHISKYIKNLKSETQNMNSKQEYHMSTLKLIQNITQKLHTNSPNVSTTTFKHIIKVEVPNYKELKLRNPHMNE